MSHFVDEDAEDPLPTRPTQHSTEEQEILHVNVNDEVIEINNVRLFSLDEVALGELQNCTSLSMRKNLIHILTDFPESLRRNLVELDFFDNKIRKIGTFFAGFSSLTKLDLSYNQIKEISGLEPLAPTLTELFLVENRIKEISGLDLLVNLRVLELGGNKLREVGDGLKELVNLEELWLGKNKIAQLGNAFNNLSKLRRLSLQANRLTQLSEDVFPANANPALTELYLSENGLQEISHVSNLSSIRLLDYSFNPIRVINTQEINPTTMPLLEEFWLTDGKVDEWDEVSKFCGFAETLRTVYLERNPIEQDKRYRDKVFLALPFLSQIDSWPIVNKNNVEADRAIHRR
jgi:protein phosphatase 1 regulatory subunit 7